MTDQVTIAPAGVADAGEILTVQRAAYLVEAQRYADPFLPPLTETLDEVRAALAGPTIVLAARRGPRLIGSVRVRIDGDTAHVGRLSVAPDQQGRGVGGLLLAAAEAACAGRVARLALFTGAASAENVRLYQRHGYVLLGHRPLNTGPGLVDLAKTLDVPADADV
ncbi:GNAT family N-acetyltransferase [Micromonospora auratinigra]|uniref:Ribosomal protein S18 acetylase RimI n=1 Tax=Micromonospora auratinigra TaxID=261654 RepID=A0A1A8YZQ6_9ACTN|nr:GNAT family N-acetyltransferase [Micromonospora auratinigra]SBT36941.1 Ribosomal protein S18 acetylase RimI [Micromonospora auratinigra]